MFKKNLQFKKSYIFTGSIGLIGGVVFLILHIPVPWLLGPLLAIVIVRNIFRKTLNWREHFRDFGLVIIGYTIGLSLTRPTLKIIIEQLPFMFVFTVLLLVFCSITAFFMSKLFKIDYNTSLLASAPGGLSQVLIIAEETKKIDLTVVTITQSIRLMLIIIIIPLLLSLPFFKNENVSRNFEILETNEVDLFPTILLFLFVSFIFIYFFKKMNLPTASLLGPLIGTAFLQSLGVSGPILPVFLSNGAQMFIGIHIGLMINIFSVTNKKNTLIFAFSSGFLLLLGSFILSLLLGLLHSLNQATGLLSLAPGGLDQMGVIAREIGADLAIVSSYQLFRLLFIFLAVPTLAKQLLK